MRISDWSSDVCSSDLSSSAPVSRISRTAGSSLSGAIERMTRRRADTLVRSSALSTEAADPTNRGTDTSCTRPDTQARTVTSGPMPAGSPTMVPMQGRNPACCDATPTSNAVDIEHRLREVVDDDGIFAFYHKGVAHRFEIVNGRPTVDRRPILQDRGHRPIRPRPNDVVLMVDREQAKDMGSARGRRTGRRPARPNAIDAVLEHCPGRILDQRNLAPWVLGQSAADIPRGDPLFGDMKRVS